jgi:hypothetical protein
VVAQRFESFLERERPQRGLAPATSLRRKVAIKNVGERATTVACREGGDSGDGLWRVSSDGSELQHGMW